MANWTQQLSDPDENPQVVLYTARLDSSVEQEWDELQQWLLDPLSQLQEQIPEVESDWTTTTQVLGHEIGFAPNAHVGHFSVVVRPQAKHAHVVLVKLQPPGSSA